MKAKKLIAAFMAMAISCGAVHTANYCSPGRFLVSAEDESLVWLGGMYYDEESKILYINGKIGAESIRSLRDNPNIHGVQALDGAVLPEDCSYLFSGFSNSEFIDLRKADASKVKTMKGMFSGYRGTGGAIIKGLDTSNVTDMSYMFSSTCMAISLEGLDTSNVTDMSYMYSGNKSEYLRPGAIDTSNVTSMKGMFKGTDTNYLDLYHFDTSKVTDMSEMFMNCCHYDSLSIKDDEPALIYNKTAPVLCSFDTSKVTDMSNMFSGCGFDSLDLTSFDTSNVTDMSGMFNESTRLIEITAGEKWDTAAVTNSENMFNNCYCIKGGNGTTYDSGHIDKEYARIDKAESLGYLTFGTATKYAVLDFDEESGTLIISGGIIRNEDLEKYRQNETVKNVVVKKSAVFPENCHNLFSDFKCEAIDLSEADTSNVTDMTYMFYGCTATRLDLSSFDTSNVTNMVGMFKKCGAEELDLSSFDTSNVTDMGHMFYDCRVKELDLSSFDTSNVTDMGHMFNGCLAAEIDLSSFDTSNVTNMVAMFKDCRVQELELSGFDTSKVTNMTLMFARCKVQELDLSSFDTSNVIGMTAMFEECIISKLDLSNFDTANVTSMGSMFSKCTYLNTVLVSDKWNTEKVTASWNMFEWSGSIVGENGTKYDSKHTDKEYARIDRIDAKGYFTEKKPVQTTTTTTTTITTTTTTTTTAVTSVATTSSAMTTTAANIASDEQLAQWASHDYMDKNDAEVGDVDVKPASDGMYEIVLKDKDNKVLDTYTIDPKTGKGTNSANEKVDLPQTGNNSMTDLWIVFGALFMIGLGLAALKLSRRVYRKKDD